MAGLKNRWINLHGLLVLAIGVSVFFATVSSTHASTLTDIINGMKEARSPESLLNITCDGTQELDLTEGSSGLIPETTTLFAAWRNPGDWLIRYEVSGESYSGTGGYNSHPSVDHVFFARPDCMDFLELEWTVEYQGSAVWEGEPAYSLFFRKKDMTLQVPGFTMYVSKDRMVPLRTEVNFGDGTSGITDFSWVVVGDVFVPASFKTEFSPSVGPLNGYTTTFFNHEINGDISDVNFTRTSGTVLSTGTGEDEGDTPEPTGFEELYHGFEEDTISAMISDSNGEYDGIDFTFALYVDDRDVYFHLDDVKDEVIDVAVDVISGWDWSGSSGLSTLTGKYECGRSIRLAINDYLSTDSITDFYFIEFEPTNSSD